MSAAAVSALPTAAELDEQIEIAAGRRAPYTQVGDWIALSGIPDQAVALYWRLAMHVNTVREDNEVWPARVVLAELAGLNRPQSIDPYIKALLKLGAINVERRRTHGGLRARNVYTVHQTPPPGYKGLTSLEEFYKRRKAALATDETAAQPVVRSSAPRKAPGKTAGGTVVRSTASPRVRSTASPEMRPTAQELEEVELEEVEPTAGQAPVDNSPPPTVGKTSSSDLEEDNENHYQHVDYDVNAVAASIVAETPPKWKIDDPTAERIRRMVAERLRSGWMPADLAAKVGMDAGPPPNAVRPAGLLVQLLKDLPAEPPPTPSLPGAWLKSWCQNPACHPDTRMILTEDDQAERCTCHPNYGKPVGAATGAR